jgi:hypothetical protein
MKWIKLQYPSPSLIRDLFCVSGLLIYLITNRVIVWPNEEGK